MNKIKILTFLTAISTIISCTSCGNTNENSSIQSNNDSISLSVSDNSSESEVSDKISESSESSSEEVEEETEETIKWELKDVSAPDFNVEVIEVEGNCVEPVKKVKSFINAEDEQIKEYIESNSFYNNFEISKKTHEVIDTKSEDVEIIFDENVKDDAVGYTVYNNFSGHMNDNYSTSVEFETTRETGTTDGFKRFSISFKSDSLNFDESVKNAYELVCQVVPAEIAEYLFYGGTELELDETITNSDGVMIDINRDIETDEDELDAHISLQLLTNHDEYKSIYDDGNYVPCEMEYSLNDLIPGDIGSLDIHDSLNFASELFKPYPVYGTEYAMSNLERFSSIRKESADGREVENEYSFELKSFYNNETDNDTYTNAFDDPAVNFNVTIETIDGEIKNYHLSASFNYYALFTENTEESFNHCAKVTTEVIKKIFPDANPEIRTFEELLHEDYEYTYETTFNGMTFPVEIEADSSHIGEYVHSSVFASYKNNDLN